MLGIRPCRWSYKTPNLLIELREIALYKHLHLYDISLDLGINNFCHSRY